jgi:hypothetical protein
MQTWMGDWWSKPGMEEEKRKKSLISDVWEFSFKFSVDGMQACFVGRDASFKL